MVFAFVGDSTITSRRSDRGFGVDAMESLLVRAAIIGAVRRVSRCPPPTVRNAPGRRSGRTRARARLLGRARRAGPEGAGEAGAQSWRRSGIARRRAGAPVGRSTT